MSDCPNGEIRDLLPDLLHGRLDAAERARVEAHVASCPECRAEVELLRRARTVLAAAPQVSVARIARALPAPSRAPAVSRAVRRPAAWRGWRIAATIAVLATGGVTLATLERTGALGGDADSAIARGQVDSGRSGQPADVGYALSTGGALGDLSDAQLRGLLDDLDRLDPLPVVEPDAVVPAAASLGETL